MFSDVLARFPGSVHDSRIWKISGAGMHVENTFSIGEHILGDSGYMLRPYLLTPYRQPISTPQSNYNYAHKRTRVIIEQTFGRWKRRFHCLHGELRMSPDKVCSIIVACAVLHNQGRRHDLISGGGLEVLFVVLSRGEYINPLYK